MAAALLHLCRALVAAQRGASQLALQGGPDPHDDLRGEGLGLMDFYPRLQPRERGGTVG